MLKSVKIVKKHFNLPHPAFQLKVWIQATKPMIEVPNPLEHEWEDDAEGMPMIPDTKENQEKHASVYKTIMKRCKCKKSQCKNGR